MNDNYFLVFSSQEKEVSKMGITKREIIDLSIITICLSIILLTGSITITQVFCEIENESNIHLQKNEPVEIEVMEFNSTRTAEYWSKHLSDDVINGTFVFENSVASTTNLTFEIGEITGGINFATEISTLLPGESETIQFTVTEYEQMTFLVPVIAYIISMGNTSNNATLTISMYYNTSGTLGLAVQNISICLGGVIALIVLSKKAKRKTT